MKNKQYILLIIFLIIIAGLSCGGYYLHTKLKSIDQKVIDINNAILDVKKEISNNKEETDKQISNLSEAYAELKERPTEIVRREVIRAKSQEELLTEAVNKVAPSVVSIVVTKDVPLLEVVYENPFGDDPFFGDFGFRIPRYRQKGTTEKEVGAGTGFIINSDGYIVTNRHVVDESNARYTVLLTSGDQKSAEVLHVDSDIDIAILKIEGNNLPSISLGDSSALKLGQSVFAVGNALGEYNNSVSVGIISGLNRELEAFGGSGAEKLEGVIQTDAAINPGNSGGPLVTLSGEVIGVNVAMAHAENIGFSIPINVVKNIINSQVK